jgi:hypothetical protein
VNSEQELITTFIMGCMQIDETFYITPLVANEGYAWVCVGPLSLLKVNSEQ